MPVWRLRRVNDVRENICFPQEMGSRIQMLAPSWNPTDSYSSLWPCIWIAHNPVELTLRINHHTRLREEGAEWGDSAGLGGVSRDTLREPRAVLSSWESGMSGDKAGKLPTCPLRHTKGLVLGLGAQ